MTTRELLIGLLYSDGLELDKDYTINDDLSINLKTSVHFSSIALKKAIVANGNILPFSIASVEGDITLKRMFLKSDQGLPINVTGSMDISYNKIEKFTRSRTIGMDLAANNNLLFTMENVPKVGRSIDLSDNKLTHLTGLQEHIHGDLSINNNRLKVVAGHTIDGSLFVSNNILINEPTGNIGGTSIFENNPCNPADNYDEARW